MPCYATQGKFGFDWLAKKHVVTNAETGDDECYPGAPRIVDDEFALSIQDIVKMWCDRHANEAATATTGRITITQ